jgi:hypothetical protein
MKVCLGIIGLISVLGCGGGSTANSPFVGGWTCAGQSGQGVYFVADGTGFVFMDGEASPLSWSDDGQNLGVVFEIDGAEVPQSFNANMDNVTNQLKLGKKMRGLDCDTLERASLALVPD